MTENSAASFGMKDKLGYMFGDFGNDFTFILSSSFMLKFYTDVMGIEAAVVGLLMMAARFVDAVTDVTMGQIVDRSKPTNAGKFKPWIKRMCGPVAISSFLIYQSGLAGLPYGVKVVWMTVNGSADECRPRNAKAVMKYKRAAVPSEVAADEAKKAFVEARPYLQIGEWNTETVGADLAQCGLSGSPTKVKCIQNVVFTAKEARTVENTDAALEDLIVELIANHTIG